MEEEEDSLGKDGDVAASLRFMFLKIFLVQLIYPSAALILSAGVSGSRAHKTWTISTIIWNKLAWIVLHSSPRTSDPIEVIC